MIIKEASDDEILEYYKSKMKDIEINFIDSYICFKKNKNKFLLERNSDMSLFNLKSTLKKQL